MPLPIKKMTAMLHQGHPESGVALILIAVIVVFLGVFMSLGLGIFETKEAPDRELATKRKLERVTRHLSAFVHRNYRVPCPADPSVIRNTPGFGVEDRDGTGEVCDILEGIVPFRSLGISERDVVDSWGSFLTYAVSPVFAEIDTVADTGVNVHEQCLTLEAWRTRLRLYKPDDTGDDTPDREEPAVDIIDQMNPRKAKFCCPGATAPFSLPNTDLRVAQGPALPARDPAAGNFKQIDSEDALVPGTIATGDYAAYAVVLLSHGPNKLGAFDIGGGGPISRIPGAAAPEDENADGDRDYSNARRSLIAGANYFDDLVIARTQHQLYSEVNNGSCARPFR